MTQFASFAIGRLLPSASISEVLVFIGIGEFFLSWYKRSNRLLIKTKKY